MIRHEITVMGKRAVYWERNPHWPHAIVLLHGFRGNHKGLTDIAQHLPGYRLILPDLPGYGESEPLEVPHSLVHYAAWLDEFVGALELEDFVVWSHSYSGSIALIQAARGQHKPLGMVSVSLAAIRRDFANWMATWYYWAAQPLPNGWRKRWLTSRTIDHITGRWLFHTVTTQRRKELMRRGDRNLPELNPKVITEEYMSALVTNLDRYAKHVEVPVLVIAGAKDIIVPLSRLERLVSLMHRGELTVMPDQGHLAPQERPAATARISREFIEQLHRRG